MQFVANGPVIPEALLDAHEDGRVVFFCGAGISYPANLPLFKGLVQDIFKRTGMSMDSLEKSAFENSQYDATLDLLERRHRGGRLVVRRALADALRPNLRRPGATNMHEALLNLARDRKGALRLLTTNFDRIFEVMAKRLKLPHTVFSAPMLPIPKSSRWNGLVYLHGLQPKGEDDAALHRLVVTSGDFGLAYLTERWAARFVTELFRNYVVCFVGYSINDPVLRYMMDALAADRMLGEYTPQAYAFGSSRPGQEAVTANEWRAKGVEPILYTVGSASAGSQDHSALPRTLQAWARTYRAGALGKESIVVEHALSNPAESTAQDDFVGRMLWALSHTDGLPAKRFAQMDPPPPLTWLAAFAEERFGHGDLRRFGVPPHATEDKKLRFSLIRRPAPYQLAPGMVMFSQGETASAWDPVMHHMAQWLARHLNNPELLLWLAGQGRSPHPALASNIERELNHYVKLERDGDNEQLELIRNRSPDAIPSLAMRRLWRVYLAGQTRSLDDGLFGWIERFRLEGLTTSLRLGLRALLSPKVSIHKSWRLKELDDEVSDSERVRSVIDWDVGLAADNIRSELSDWPDPAALKQLFTNLLSDFQQLLRDVLDVMRELDDADDHRDPSCWDLPSIIPHQQNRGFRDWVVLIEWIRDGWQGIREIDRRRAARIADDWFAQPYPCFKRLALYAASQESSIPPELWVSWLLSDGRRWLWAVETMRERMRLLVLRGAQMLSADQVLLESAILDGPPRELYPDSIDANDWRGIIDQATWLHLAKLKSSGLTLGLPARQRLEDLQRQNPDWRLAENQSDEFSIWTGGTGDEGYEERRQVDRVPRQRTEIVEWLKRSLVPLTPFHEDTWRDACRMHSVHAALALGDLADEGVWPPDRWRTALQAWSEKTRIKRSWLCMAPVIQRMPDGEFAQVARGVAWWLEAAAKTIGSLDPSFFALCERVLGLEHKNGVQSNQPVTRAINHPVGHVTQALIGFWFREEPNDGDGLTPEIARFFTRLCDVNNLQFRHGRVILASRLIALYRVDRAWTERWLLPLMDWDKNPEEARATWEGFLWSPRLYLPLLLAFKRQFLATAKHYEALGEHARQFAAFLTYAALDPVEGYTTLDFQAALSALPTEGLQQVVHTLAQALEGAGQQREEYWRSRMVPFWSNIWPKDRQHASAAMTNEIARLAIAAGEEFPAALRATVDWLLPMTSPGYVIRKLKQSRMAERKPREALQLLDAIVGTEGWPSGDLRQCLIAISGADSALKNDKRFVRLDDYCRARDF